MKRDYIDFQERSQPIGYLITIRCYGTWLHGNEPGSMDRRAFNKVGGDKRPANRSLERSDEGLLKNPPVTFGAAQRMAVEAAIKEVCEVRVVAMYAINVRTNHAHIVIGTSRPPESIMNSFKAYATRKLREEGLVKPDGKIWSRHGSTRYLWTEEHILTDKVKNCHDSIRLDAHHGRPS